MTQRLASASKDTSVPRTPYRPLAGDQATRTRTAATGAKRRDIEQVVTFGREALQLARESSSGYVARRLLGLRDEFGPLARDGRVAELGVEIAALSTT